MPGGLPPRSMPAPVSNHAHANTIVTPRLAMTAARSRRANHSAGALVDDAGMAEVDARELTVRVVEVKLDIAYCFGTPAPDFGNTVLETVGNIDAHAMFCTSEGVANGLTRRFHDSWHHQPGIARVDIDLELDLSGERVKFRRAHSCVDPPHGRCLGRILAGHDPEQRLTLVGRGTFLDDELHLPVAFVHGTRPRLHDRRTEAVEPDVPVPTFVDLPRDHSFTIAQGRQRVKLARTPITTVTVRELAALNLPLNLRHY